jgi:hypothetical protein
VMRYYTTLWRLPHQTFVCDLWESLQQKLHNMFFLNIAYAFIFWISVWI